MSKKIRNVVFANDKLEADFMALEKSERQEDKRLYGVLCDARRVLERNPGAGREVVGDEIPEVYRKLFRIDNLWSLSLKPDITIFYSVVGDEFWIVDLL